MPHSAQTTVVSLQRWGQRADPVGAHLAAGLLAERDLVMVPDPPSSVVSGEEPIEVLVAPATARAEEAVVEWLPVQGVRVLQSGEGDDARRVALVQLAAPSRVGTLLPSYDGREVDRAFTVAQPSTWSALAAAGALPEATDPRTMIRRLPGIADLERARATPVTEILTTDSGQFNFQWCKLIRCCAWPGPPGGSEEGTPGITPEGPPERG